MINIVSDATILSSMMSCERLTDFRINDSLVPTGGKSNSLECGSIVHTFMEYYYKALIAGKSKSDAVDEGFRFAKLYINGCPVCMDLTSGTPSCGHKVGDFSGVKNTPEKSIGAVIGWAHALDTCLQYLARWVSDAWTPLAVEETRGEIIYKDADIQVLWKAKFDLIVDTNQAILSVDHKTMKQRRDSLSLNNQFMGQCVLMKSRNVIINKIGFQTTLKPQEKFERAMISYSKDRLDEWQNVIVPFWARRLAHCIQTDTWAPNFTHCENKYGFCSMKEVCESDRNMRDEVIKLNYVKGRVWDV